jgi:hypothetical protein
MTRQAALTAVFLLNLLVPRAGLAGAWVQPEGEAYVRLTGGYLATDERFDRDGNKIPFHETTPTEYQDLLMALYAEVGIDGHVALITDLAWKAVDAKVQNAATGADSSTAGFADAGLGLKVVVAKWNTTVTSVGAMLRFPTGYDPDDYPALGSDVSEITLSAQMGDASIKSWINGEAYFMLRGGDFRNQVGGALAMGFDITRILAFRGEARGGLPLGDARVNDDPQVDPADFDPSFFDLAATLSLKVARGLAVEAEARNTLGGRNTLRSVRWTFGIATSPTLRLWEPSRVSAAERR